MPIHDPALPKPRIGILGVGRMGLPIARSLIAAGFNTTVFDPNEERSARAGAAVSPSARHLVASVDVVITVLPGSPELETLMRAVLPLMPPKVLWLDLTSLDPAIADSLGALAAAHDIAMIGAPMAGGVTAAESSSLTFYAGGCSASLARIRPVLETLGTIDHIGESVGDGYTAKLLANLLWFGQVVAVTEALLLGQARGISPHRLRTTLAASAGGSVFIDEYLDRLLAGDYAESFGLERCVEELNAVVALAEASTVPFELSAVVARLHREALERFGAVDGELLAAKLLEERAGQTLRR